MTRKRPVKHCYFGGKSQGELGNSQERFLGVSGLALMRGEVNGGNSVVKNKKLKTNNGPVRWPSRSDTAVNPDNLKSISGTQLGELTPADCSLTSYLLCVPHLLRV